MESKLNSKENQILFGIGTVEKILQIKEDFALSANTDSIYIFSPVYYLIHACEDDVATDFEEKNASCPRCGIEAPKTLLKRWRVLNEL